MRIVVVMLRNQKRSTSSERVGTTRRRKYLAAAAVTVAVFGVGVGSYSAVAAMAGSPAGGGPGVAGGSSSAPSLDTSTFKHGGNGIFTDRCTHTKTAADDPIMMPGMTGQSMVHDFFGNTAPTADSTPDSLLGGSTGCSTSADSSSYWVPQLYQNGHALTPTSTLLYWRASKTQSPSVKTIPAGLTMITGNAEGTQPAGTDTVAWGCASPDKVAKGAKIDATLTASPHECTTDHDLREVITFPDCWDGKTLNGQGRQNVVNAASTDAPCPASHPVRIPQIVMHLNYPTISDAGLSLSVSPTQNGPVTTAHADFMNGWKQSALDADVSHCVAAQTRCAGVTGADAIPQGSKASPHKKQLRKHARQQRSGGRATEKTPAH